MLQSHTSWEKKGRSGDSFRKAEPCFRSLDWSPWVCRLGALGRPPGRAGSPLGSSLEPRASGLRGPLEAEAREAALGGSHVPLADGGNSGNHRDRREFKLLVPE